jgi:chromosome segregation ATPase
MAGSKMKHLTKTIERMKHQEFRNRDAYARRYGELVAENVAMEQRIHRLARDYNRVAKKLRNLEDEHEDVVAQLENTEANLKELHNGYTNVCNANIAQGRETDNLRNVLAKLRSENADLKQERSALIDLLEEKGFTLVKNTECPHDMVETGDPFYKENPETVRVDSCACWNCEYFCLRLKDRGKIVCKEGQKRKQQDNKC